MLQRIHRIPGPIQIAKPGGMQVCGVRPKQQASLDQPAEVAAARTTNTQLCQRLPQDNTDAELYLFTVLQDSLLYDDMKTVVEEMLRKQPGNREIQELAEWVRVRI